MSQKATTVMSGIFNRNKGKISDQIDDLHRAGVDVSKNDSLTYLLALAEAYVSYVDNMEIIYSPETRKISLTPQHHNIDERITVLNRLVHLVAALGEGSEDRRFAKIIVCWEKLMKHWRWHKMIQPQFNSLDNAELIDLYVRRISIYVKRLREYSETNSDVLLQHGDLIVQISDVLSRYGGKRNNSRDDESRLTEYGELVIIPWGMMIKNFVFKEKHFVPQHANVIVQQPQNPFGANMMMGGEENPIIANARSEGAKSPE